MAQQRACRTVDLTTFSIGDELRDDAVELVCFLEIDDVTGALDHLHSRFGDEVEELVGKFGGSDEILVTDEDQGGDSDPFGAVALVGQPYGFGADTVSGGVDA